MSPTEKLLPLLHKVKRTGPGRWIARCPAHNDKSPSLALREERDGRLLIHCFAGCGAVEILGCVGLALSDQYPGRPSTPGGGHKRVRRPFNSEQLIEIAAREACIGAVILCDVLSGQGVTAVDIKRGIVAASTLAEIAEVVRG